MRDLCVIAPTSYVQPGGFSPERRGPPMNVKTHYRVK